MTTMIRRYAVGGMMAVLGLTLLAGTAQAVLSYWPNPVTIQLSYAYPGTVPGFNWRAGSLGLTDFNNNGQIDAAVPGAYVSGVCIVQADGSQNWLTTGAWPIAVATGDFDGDGDADLAVAEQDGGGVAVYTNDGLGNMTRTFYSTGNPAGPVGPTAVLPADIDRDGRLDLVVANRFAETVVVLHNTGPGFLMAQVIGVPGEPNALAAADLNNDGWTDIAVACAADDTVKTLKSFTGMLVYIGTFPAGPYPVAVAAADLNADGNIDLAVADREAPQVTVLLSNGAGGYTGQDVMLELPGYGAFEPPADVQLVDMNGSGTIDMSCGGKDFRNDGAGNFTILGSPSWSLGSRVVYARGFVSGMPYPLLGAGYRPRASGTYGAETIAVNPFYRPAVNPVPGDVDGDGHVDVVDLLYVVDSFGTSVGDTGFVPRSDLNRDGTVDVADLLAVVGNFGA